MDSVYAVIMAGGRGERFWPLSTSKRPKQLHDLVGDKTLIAQAVERLEGLIPIERIFVITNSDIVDATLAAAPKLKPENVIGEPFGRDTAAAVACAAAVIKSRDDQAVFAILTADQVMGDVKRFQATLRTGLQLASENDILVTIGIQPTFPSTGFGYIESGDVYAEKETVIFRIAKRFIEKPDIDRATAYLETGQFFWNAGMFIWSVDSLEKALRKYSPETFSLMESLKDYADQDEIQKGMQVLYPKIEKISIDYALMEKADNIVMACGNFDWDDLGTWTSLENHFKQDKNKNTLIGNISTLNSKSNIVYSKDRYTALLDVEDLIVIHGDGVTMICPKNSSQSVKNILAKINKDHPDSGLI